MQRDFMREAAASEGSFCIFGLASVNRHETLSRMVSKLDGGVVTSHGAEQKVIGARPVRPGYKNHVHVTHDTNMASGASG